MAMRPVAASTCIAIAAAVSIAMAIDPWTIYDKLDPSIYRDLGQDALHPQTTSTLVYESSASFSNLAFYSAVGVSPTDRLCILNFSNSPLSQMLDFYEEQTGIAVIQDPSWPSNVTLKTTSPVTIPVAVRLVEQLLSLSNSTDQISHP